MDWRLKGTIQKVLGLVPGGERLHYALQKRGGGLSNFATECNMKVDDWRLMMGYLATTNVAVAGATMLEMGTGWYPTFPLCFHLAGATHVHTVDLNPYLKPEKTRALVTHLLETHVPLIARLANRAPAAIAERLRAIGIALHRGASITDATGGGVDYHAPADAARTDLPAASLDVVFSNSVLEHVPKPVIEACFVEARRILKPGGVACHAVNCGDHYAYSDARIDQLHYLQFSDAAWARWNNAFLYQNRLRAIDFLEIARAAGFAIELDTSRARPERLASLDKLAVDPSFKRYTREQLAVTSVDFVARRPTS